MNDQHLHIQSSAALHQNRNIKAEFKEGSLRTNVNVKKKKKNLTNSGGKRATDHKY